MKNHINRIILFLAASVLLILTFSSCNNSSTPANAGADTSKLPWGSALAKYKDSSDIPTWTGKKLTLNYWVVDGGGGITNYLQGADDVVRKEITRVTGVTINEEKSFDNNGEDFDTKYAEVNASSNWPSITLGIDNQKTLADTNNLYDLTPYMSKYCPDVYKVMDPNWSAGIWSKVGLGQNNKDFLIPLELPKDYVPLAYPQADKSKYSTVGTTYQYIWIRDDILKMIYPKAKTEAQIEQEYVDKGYYSLSYMLDVTISSEQQLTDLYKKIKALNLKGKDGQPVVPMAAYDGVDNWGLFGITLPALEGLGLNESQYYFHFDNNTKQLVSNVKSPVFKNDVNLVWSWLQDGLSSQESLVDNETDYETKFNNGLYATTDAGYWQPDNAALKANGFKFQYRKLFITTPYASDTVNFVDPPYAGNYMGLSTKGVKKEDIPQILRFVDFMFTEPGQKLVGWGPKTAGLFTEDANGVRKYTKVDSGESLEDQMLNVKKTDLITKYGLGFNDEYESPDLLSSTGWLPLAIQSNYGIFGPYYQYNVRKAADYSNAFSPDILKPKSPEVVAFDPSPWSFANDQTDCPKFNAVWNKKTVFNEALHKVLTAKNESEFDTLYNKAMQAADQIGLTDPAVLKEVNAFYKNENAQTDLYK